MNCVFNGIGMDYHGGSSAGGFGNGGFSGEASQGSGGRGGNRKSYDEQTIQPCTIRMLLNALPEGGSDDTGSLELSDGRKLHHVVIVGAIRDFTDNSTNTEYQIEDGTGLIIAKQWIDNNDCAAKLEMRQLSMKENIYVKIIGSLKYYDGQVQLIADSIRPLTTGNELTCHMLEVVYVGEKHKNSRNAAPRNSLISNPGVGFGGEGVVLQRSGGSEGVRDSVVNYIRSEGEKQDIGANVQNCVRVLSGEYPEKEILKAIEDLAAEGHIYSTYNEDHYKFAM